MGILKNAFAESLADNQLDDIIDPDKGIIEKTGSLILDTANVVLVGAPRKAVNIAKAVLPMANASYSNKEYRDKLKRAKQEAAKTGSSVSAEDRVKLKLSTSKGSEAFAQAEEKRQNYLDAASSYSNKLPALEKKSKKDKKAGREVPAIEDKQSESAEEEISV